MSKYKAIFFDLDGTVINTLKDISEAVNYALNKYNLKTKDINIIKTYLGLGSNHLIKEAMDGECLDIFDEVYQTYKTYYLNHYDVYSRPYNGIYQFLSKLKQKGYKLALISNKPDDLCKLLINKYFKDIFDIILGQNKDFKAKPNKDMMNYVIDKLNLKNNEVLYFGDSNIDYEFARNAGVDCILNSYGYGDINILKTYNVPIIDNINDMEKYL